MSCPWPVCVRGEGAVCFTRNVFCVESAVSGVEACHKGFKTWNYTGHQRHIEGCLGPNVEICQGKCRICGEIMARETGDSENQERYSPVDLR